MLVRPKKRICYMIDQTNKTRVSVAEVGSVPWFDEFFFLFRRSGQLCKAVERSLHL